jgi:hypothetical protein
MRGLRICGLTRSAILLNANTGHPRETNSDDVGFLSALIDTLSAEFDIDPKRVYVTGLSKGAAMSYRLACERPNKITAIAPVAGGPSAGLMRKCAEASRRPIPLLVMHGTADPIVPFDSGELEGNVQYWIRRNGCTLTPVVTRLPDVDPTDGARTRVESYGNCKDSADVPLYAIEGGGHHWPGGDQPLRGRATLAATLTRASSSRISSSSILCQNLRFPEVEAPQSAFYELSESENEIFTRTIERIAKQITYARYRPLTYLPKEALDENVTAAQFNLAGFMKVLLVKRLESSFEAFRRTVGRFIEAYSRFIDAYEQGFVYVSKKKTALIFELIEEGEVEAIERLIETEEAERYDAEIFIRTSLEI